jgi:predicted DNA-binding transcriptional regulator YafY
VPHLGAISDAVWSSSKIAIEYERGDGAVGRVLEPLGVVLKAGIWYVVARVGEQIRTYRVSRVVASEPTGERFERPAGFDLAAYWSESAAAFERDVPRVEVVVRVHPDGREPLWDAVGGEVMRAAETLPDEDPEGWTRLRIRLDYPEEAAGVLLRAGPLIDVIAPPELRAEVAATARAVAARYAEG